MAIVKIKGTLFYQNKCEVCGELFLTGMLSSLCHKCFLKMPSFAELEEQNRETMKAILLKEIEEGNQPHETLLD